MISTFNNKTVLYLDFESNMKGRTFLAGFDIGDGYTTWITDEALVGWADAKQMEFAAFEDVLHLVNEADYVIAYSDAEFEKLNTLAEELKIGIKSKVQYLNAKKVAVAWAKKKKLAEYESLTELGITKPKIERPKRNSLISMIRLVGLYEWQRYGHGLVMKRLRQVETGLKVNCGVFAKLTPHQKKQASKVITHNTIDIEAMKLLTETALNDMPQLVSKFAKKF